VALLLFSWSLGHRSSIAMAFAMVAH
jgi:hypothetical protein